MNEVEEKILPFLFTVLFGFIAVNLIFNLLLYKFTKIKTIKTNCLYWGLLLLIYPVQGKFQYAEFPILLSWSLHFGPMMILSKILFDIIGREFPLRKYAILSAAGLAISTTLSFLTLPFQVSALPMCLSMSLMLFEPGIFALSRRRENATSLQRFIGFIYLLGGVHAINFALFRMVPDTQIVGYGTTLALYQILSVGMLTLSIEDYSRKEKDRLEGLVAQRTEELTSTLQVKDTLFKVVLHDIANPVQAQLLALESMKAKDQLTPVTSKLYRLTVLLRDVIQQVKSLDIMRSGKLQMAMMPVDLQQCLDDLSLIFQGPLEEKGLRLVIINELPPGTTFMANQNAFTTSVMCNLVSNAIKFSPLEKELRIRAYLKEGKIVVEVEDQGIGIPDELALGLFDPSKKRSRLGTMGERGTGYGMPLVKSFLDQFGGEIQVESRPQDAYPENHGTKVTMTLQQDLRH